MNLKRMLKRILFNYTFLKIIQLYRSFNSFLKLYFIQSYTFSLKLIRIVSIYIFTKYHALNLIKNRSNRSYQVQKNSSISTLIKNYYIVPLFVFQKVSCKIYFNKLEINQSLKKSIRKSKLNQIKLSFQILKV